MNNRNTRIMEKIDTQLRKTARQLVRFNTLDETMQSLVESFWEQFNCDYVSIFLKNGDYLDVKAKKGVSRIRDNTFPLAWKEISPLFWKGGVYHDTIMKDKNPCSFQQYIADEGFSNWLTVPIMENDSNILGLCIIGYRKVVPFVQAKSMERVFIEFGQDVASSIKIALNKERDLQKMRGIDWLKDNFFLGSSIEQVVKNVVERAGKETKSDSAYVYLYDEKHNRFIYQPPSYGTMSSPIIIDINTEYNILSHFRFFEKVGGKEITFPLIANHKIVGILHAVKTNSVFTSEDAQLLEFLSSYVSVLIENTRLYKNELDAKVRLEKLVTDTQELVIQTIVGHGFNEIIDSLSRMTNCCVVLLDRFYSPASYAFPRENEVAIDQVFTSLSKNIKGISDLVREQWIDLGNLGVYGVWKIFAGENLQGYLCINVNKDELDNYFRMMVNHSLNVLAIQIIKQKLVIEANEQVKENFINQLFAEKIENLGKLYQFSNIFSLNINEPHKVGLMSIDFNQTLYNDEDLLAQETQKSLIWERLQQILLQYDSQLILARKENYYIIFASEKREQLRENYWEDAYFLMKQSVSKEFLGAEVLLGISKSTKGIEDYFICYKQALQALKLVILRYREKGFLNYSNLGSYTVLQDLQNSYSTELFIKDFLDPLLKYDNSNNKELFKTLGVYLQKNGNLKETSEQLFIHRNSLKYRLEKIRELLNIDLDNAEIRFNLLLAYKLYDLYMG